MAPSPPSPLTIASNLEGFSPMAIRDIHLAKRADYKAAASAGAKDPRAYNNLWFQLLFAFIGIGMTLTALWFFFRAKNGGFKWQKDDWEDYKSTVLRRKGPDGKTLSNATKSTKLGGGSVVHGGSYGAPTSVGYTDETGTTVSEMREAEEGKGRRAFGIRGGDGAEKKNKRKKRHEHDNDYKDRDLRDYRDERPAKVGGLNRQADGMYTDYSATGTEPSELGSNVSARPLVKDKEKKSEKDKKKEAKAKEQRAKERMRKAKLAEKEAAKTAAAEAKAQKEAEKQAAKEKKAEQKKAKKAKSEVAPSEIGGPAMTEYTALESEYTYDAPKTEYTAPSEAPAPAPAQSASRRAPPSAAYSFTTGDDRTEYTGAYTDVSANKSRASRAAPAPSEAQESSYYSDYRPNAERSRASRSQSRPRHESRSRPSSQSPRKHHRPSRTGPSNASDIFTAANGEPRGTIAYPCHIPGLSTAGSVAPNDSVSQMGAPRGPRREERGGRDVMAGYRRGGVRTVRRDSLSDSDA